jgi:hypothetical protein
LRPRWKARLCNIHLKLTIVPSHHHIGTPANAHIDTFCSIGMQKLGLVVLNVLFHKLVISSLLLSGFLMLSSVVLLSFMWR